MPLERVIFGIANERIESLYDRSQLKLGSKVYVHFSQDRKPVSFSPRPSHDVHEFGVRWISPSEWYVVIVPPFTLPTHFTERIQREVGQYINRAKIDVALNSFARRVRMDRFYQTAELGNNPLSVIFTVLNRLDDCARLRQSPPFSSILSPHLDDPLVSYLYLTCFDRLGQPAEWLDFGAWLQSSDSEDERRKALEEASLAPTLNEGIQAVYRQYMAAYGVKMSFFRFFREVLPVSTRRKLLDSIERTIITNPPELATRQATDEEKEKYLFKRRNDYTHKLDFRPPIGEWLGQGFGTPVQEFHAEYWTSTHTCNWPDVLEEAVRVGLARYLEINSSAKTP